MLRDRVVILRQIGIRAIVVVTIRADIQRRPIRHAQRGRRCYMEILGSIVALPRRRACSILRRICHHLHMGGDVLRIRRHIGLPALLGYDERVHDIRRIGRDVQRLVHERRVNVDYVGVR